MVFPDTPDGSLHPPSSPDQERLTLEESHGEEGRTPKARIPVLTSWIPPSRSFENNGHYSVARSLRRRFRRRVWRSLSVIYSMSDRSSSSSFPATLTEPSTQHRGGSLRNQPVEDFVKSDIDTDPVGHTVRAWKPTPHIVETDSTSQTVFKLFGSPQVPKLTSDLVSLEQSSPLSACRQHSNLDDGMTSLKQDVTKPTTSKQTPRLKGDFDFLALDAAPQMPLGKASKLDDNLAPLEQNVILPASSPQYSEDEISLHSWNDMSTVDSSISPHDLDALPIENDDVNSLYLDPSSERQVSLLTSKKMAKEFASVNGIWKRVLQLRERVSKLREQYQDQRNVLHILQDSKASADEEYMKMVRTRHAILSDSLTWDGQTLKELEELRKKCQAIRDQYGPEENDLGYMEERLRDEETKLTRVETILMNHLQNNIEIDIQYSDASSVTSSEQNEPRDDPYEDYLTRLGNADLLRERLGDLDYERGRLLMEQQRRHEIGMDLESDDLDYLDDYPLNAAETRRELAEVEADVTRLQLLCIERHLIDAPRENSHHNPDQASEHTFEKASEHDSLSPALIQQPKVNLLEGESLARNLETSELRQQTIVHISEDEKMDIPVLEEGKDEIPIQMVGTSELVAQNDGSIGVIVPTEDLQTAMEEKSKYGSA